MPSCFQTVNLLLEFTCFRLRQTVHGDVVVTLLICVQEVTTTGHPH
jgi:hypothetical protein